jgi:decaprenylphospho-beta-D-ribofuranose 2-oxidase
MRLSGWGRFPVHDAVVFSPRDEKALIERVRSGVAIARGNGRAYGDSAVSRQNTVHMRHFDRMIAFDRERGQLTAESGVLLADIIRAFLPIGWFPAVTPGTKFVTLGGMIAADVHGKNHHKDGGFGNFVDWVDLVDHTGTVRRCSRQENSDLFDWTVGGMGLTGIILRAAIRLRQVETAWIKQTILPARDLDHSIDLFEQVQEATYSAAWIDCLSPGKELGRSLIMLGEHAAVSDLTGSKRKAPLDAGHRLKKSVPFDFPAWSLNRFTVGAFNAVYYWNGRRKQGEALVDWDTYFYPLDSILGWNRIYGRHGFAQYQCVLPLEQSRAGFRALLDVISRSGAGSFLGVLKRLGAQKSRFSFPMEGYTLALDFPVNKRMLALMDSLDRITLAHGGRFYLAKDSRMTADTLRQSDNRAQEFAQMRSDQGLRPTFQSAQSERLDL